MRFPGNPTFLTGDSDAAEPKIGVDRHPKSENERMRGSRTVSSEAACSGADRKSGRRRAGYDCAVKMNLSAPAIWPEIAAEAPTTGAISPKWQGEMSDGAGNAAQDREDNEFAVADAACHRAAKGEHPEQIDPKMHPSRMHHHVGDKGRDAGEIARPGARAAAPL